MKLSLGTDGAASNNDLDMFGEMRTAALLAKGSSGNASAFPAQSVIRAATINGATAMGLEGVCGSIEVGKFADLVAVDLRHCSTQPVYDPVSQLVYSAGRDNVSKVWVAGNCLYNDGALTTLDEAALLDKARIWGEKIRS